MLITIRELVANSTSAKVNSEHKSHGMARIRKRIAALGYFVDLLITMSMYPASDNDKNPGNKITLFIPSGLYDAWLVRTING